MIRVITRLIPGVVGAWLVTLAIATLGSTIAATARNPESAGELALLFPLLMSVPFALTAVFVLLPSMSLVLRRSGGRLWPLMAAAVVAAPLQAFALLAGGRILFRGSPHLRPALADDVVAVLGHPSSVTIVMLGAFAAGGIVLGFWSRRRPLHLTNN
jgi:uncharacterized membrane protein YhaH (DUF805 family)